MLLVILCGIPCSGKTQLAVMLAKELDLKHGLSTIVVDPDKMRSMIPALSERFDPGRESFLNSLSLALINESLRQDSIVISDDMNYFESARHRLVQIAKKHHAEYAIVYLTVSVDIAQKRNAARETPIPQEIISEIARNLDPPGSKYKWDHPAIVINSEKVTPEESAKQILPIILDKIRKEHEKSKSTVRGSESTRKGLQTQEPSSREVLDESTRKILNELFSSGQLDAKLSRQVSKIRREFLSQASRESTSIMDSEAEFKRVIMELIRRRTKSANS